MKATARALALAAALASPRALADEQAPEAGVSPATPAFPLRVDEIRIEGLVRTEPFVVRDELGFTEGDVITRADLDLAVARLWNTTIFAHVLAEVSAAGPRHVLVVTLEDRFTLNPLFSFGSGGSATYVRVGASDNNIAGRFLEAKAQYENFSGFHGGQVVLHDPRLFRERLELFLTGERLTRPRPGFSDQRTSGVVEVQALARGDRLRVGGKVSIFADRYLPPLDPPPFTPPETTTALVEPSLRVGRVDTVRLRQTGASLEVRPGVGFVLGDARFATVTTEALGFAMLGERFNFAVRARVAATSDVREPLQVYAGGLDLVRGVPDNYIRARALALTNVELRAILFDSTWIALVPTVFTDAAVAKAPAGRVGSVFAVGAGLRVLVPKFVGTGLRLDAAVPLVADVEDAAVDARPNAPPAPPQPHAKTGALSFSVGVYQFF